ncbi:MAG: D-aminoacyl-tRNA deacylase [candidate division Zixibacteria bacterium]
MRLVIQRVSRALVTVFDEEHPQGFEKGRINRGLVILLGLKIGDQTESAARLAKKVSELRIFEDDLGKMNKSILDIEGEFLVISQFTLYGDTRKGRRPSFTGAMPPDEARKMYERFVELLTNSGLKVETGSFRSKMEVEIINDGPVTFVLEDDMP